MLAHKSRRRKTVRRKADTKFNPAPDPPKLDLCFTKDVKRRRALQRKRNIMFNLYAEVKIAEQRRAELEQQAERERQVTKLIRWIKQEKRDEVAKQMQAQTPQVIVYEN
jgi:hypothetical protein